MADSSQDQSNSSPQYLFKGMNRDVSKFIMQDAELLLSRNFYSPIYGSKSVRFGYSKFLDNPDDSPVRNLNYYTFPNKANGITRISGKKTYNYNLSSTATSWGANVKTWTVDTVTGNTIVEALEGGDDGTFGTAEVLSNGTDPMTFTLDGVTFTDITDPSTPFCNYLTTWNSRVLGNLGLSLIESAIDFNKDDPFTLAPFTIDNNDPSAAGSISVNSGAYGSWVGVTNALNNAYVYTQQAVSRFTGSQIQRMPFFGYIFANTVCNTKDNVDYFLCTQGIMRNDGNTVTLANFGVNTIVKDTLRLNGLNNPFSFSFGYYTFFHLGTITVGNLTFNNTLLVHDEQFDQWDIWTLAHQMTCFGYFIDPISGRPVLISGDINGNTYRWGEEYSTDNGVPIEYQLRTKYYVMGNPDTSDQPDIFSFSTANTGSSTVSAATDYSDIYRPVENFVAGFLKKMYVKFATGLQYKTISLEISGTTTVNMGSFRPEITGLTLRTIDEELPQGSKS